MTGPNILAGITVLEIADGIAGPMAGKVLRDLGASVTRIEPPWGDWLAKLVPDVPGGDAAYQELNAGKQMLTLDLATPAGQARMRELAVSTDICIVGVRHAKLAKLGLSYAELKKIAPRMIYCHISGWGSDGPMADQTASELSIQVTAGLTRYLGERNGPPVRQGFDLVSVDTGIAAVDAALAALLWRETTGESQYVEVSMIATAVALMQWDIVAESAPDAWVGRQLDSQEWPPDHGFQCADARCLIDLRSNEEAWPSLLRDIGCADLAADERFTTRKELDQHVTKLTELTIGPLSKWKYADLERLVRDKYDGTIVPMLSVPEVLAHPQIEVIGLIDPGPPARMRFPVDATLVGEPRS